MDKGVIRKMKKWIIEWDKEDPQILWARVEEQIDWSDLHLFFDEFQQMVESTNDPVFGISVLKEDFKLPTGGNPLPHIKRGIQLVHAHSQMQLMITVMKKHNSIVLQFTNLLIKVMPGINIAKYPFAGSEAEARAIVNRYREEASIGS